MSYRSGRRPGHSTRRCRECGKPSSTTGLICRCSCYPVEYCGSGWTNDRCKYRLGHEGDHSNP